jgi:hypothetical protein
MKTAVEWLVEQMTQGDFIALPKPQWIKQAKEMEKEQIIDFAYDIADDLACGVLSKKVIEDRYNENFKSE